MADSISGLDLHALWVACAVHLHPFKDALCSFAEEMLNLFSSENSLFIQLWEKNICSAFLTLFWKAASGIT